MHMQRNPEAHAKEPRITRKVTQMHTQNKDAHSKEPRSTRKGTRSTRKGTRSTCKGTQMHTQNKDAHAKEPRSTHTQRNPDAHPKTARTLSVSSSPSTHHPPNSSWPTRGGAVLFANLSQVVCRGTKHLGGVGPSPDARGVCLDLTHKCKAGNSVICDGTTERL